MRAGAAELTVWRLVRTSYDRRWAPTSLRRQVHLWRGSVSVIVVLQAAALSADIERTKPPPPASNTTSNVGDGAVNDVESEQEQPKEEPSEESSTPEVPVSREEQSQGLAHGEDKGDDGTLVRELEDREDEAAGEAEAPPPPEIEELE